MYNKGNYIPTDKDQEPFEKITNPTIGKSYHLSWAYKGARFILRSIDGRKCVVWTGNSKNKLLTVNTSDLRAIRKKW